MKANFRFLLIVFLSVVVGVTKGFTQQLAEISGTVMSASTNQPLMGVVVQWAESGASTNESGYFSFQAPAGTAAITARFIGYQTYSSELTLKEGQRLVYPILLQDADVQFSPVVISAGKYEQNLSEVTVSMEIIKPRLFEDKNAVSLEEGLQQAPGVAIVDDEPQIRSGSGYSFGAGSRVQVLLDGMPVLSGDAGKVSWGFLPMENVSQVEIIKGASSVLYGSSALSGVIHFRTAYPTDKPTVKVQSWLGAYSNPADADKKYWNNNGIKSGVNFLYAEKKGAWDLVLGASLQADDGHLGPVKDSLGNVGESKFNPLEVRRYDGDNRARINANIRRRSTKVEGLIYGVNTIFSQGTSYATLIWENDSAGLFSAYDGSATKTEQLLYTIDPFITYFGKKGGEHNLRTRWQSLDNANDNNQGNFSDVLYGEYQYQQKFDEWGIAHLTTTVGVVGMSTDARGELFSGGNTDGNNTASNVAAYLQVDKKIKEVLNVSVGVRYEQFRINNESEGRPVFRAGVNYAVAKFTFLRASYGEGYRFPSIAEKFIVTSLGAVKVFANPDLRSESSYNAELGIKQGFRIGKFQGFADVAVFQQEFENFIEFTFGQWDPNPGFDNILGLGFKSVNTGTARVRGVDFSVMGERTAGHWGIQLLAGYTYTKPVSTSPDLIYGRGSADPSNPFVLDNLASVSYATTSSDPTNNILKYRLEHLVRADVGVSYKKWNTGVSVRYNSHMQNIDSAFETLEDQFPSVFNPGIIRWRREHTTGDTVVDLRLGYRLSTKHRVALVANNVMNRVYAIRPLALEDTRLILLQYSFSL